MQAIDNAQTVVRGAVQHSHVQAVPIDDDLSWGVGLIQPDHTHDSDEDRRTLTDVVLDSLSVVNESETAYSSCTDGRAPIRLTNGEAVPVREQLVGADTMLVFHMAEVLGPRFYKDPEAPLQDRLKEVASFLNENGLKACTHVGCGAAAAYVTIVQNLVNFTRDERFIARQKQLLPEGVYDEDLRATITAGYEDRLSKDRYKDWSDALVTEAVQTTTPGRGIAELNDDGRGVHGHVEEQIIRIQVEGVATNELQVIARTSGREVFSVNDLRMRRLAQLMGRGQDQDYKMALMAAEDFTDGGHGTLAKDLPTFVIKSI